MTSASKKQQPEPSPNATQPVVPRQPNEKGRETDPRRAPTKYERSEDEPVDPVLEPSVDDRTRPQPARR